MSDYVLGIIFLVLNFLHGIFAAGFIPILNKELGVDSALPFALYFLGILLGQIAIYRFPILSKSKNSYPIYEIFFGSTLIFMAFYNTKFGFNLGRLLEGLATGFTTPVLFSNVIQLNTVGSEGKRLALFNSVSAIGYVLGPVCISFLITYYDYKQTLLFFGALFIITPIIMFSMKLRGSNELKDDLSLKTIFRKNPWFEKFSTLFLGKSFYGFFLAFVPSYFINYFDKTMTVSKIMIIFSIIFIIGQVITEKIISIIPKEHLELYIPIIMASSLLAFFVTSNTNFMYVSALCQSILLFIGYLNFTIKTNNAREFALFNSISDPAIVMGAFLATLGSLGIWGIMIILLIPVTRALTLPNNYMRAEYFYPFLGPISMYKMGKKHGNPLKKPLDIEIQEIIKDNLQFDNFSAISNSENGINSAKIKLVFTGDFCPSPEMYSLSENVKDFVLAHDIRAINFEGVLTDTKREDIKKWYFHNIPIDDFQRIIIGNEKPVFNVLSMVNNHVFDFGIKEFHKTKEKLNSNKELNIIDSDLKIIEINNRKIGFFALTFGVNFLWLKDDSVKRIKPEKIIRDKKIQKKIKAMVSEYKSKVDLLILSYHWGYESEYLPSNIQRECFEILSKAGVDIIHGHHSHIVQPYEIKDDNSKLCIYSCGNFTHSVDMDNTVYKQGVFFSVHVDFIENKPVIEKVEPRLFQPFGDNLDFIDNEKTETYQNWKIYQNQ